MYTTRLTVIFLLTNIKNNFDIEKLPFYKKCAEDISMSHNKFSIKIMNIFSEHSGIQLGIFKFLKYWKLNTALKDKSII